MAKTLSIRQPWAWLIVNADGYEDPKRIENRSWGTRFRGEILIHAGKSFDLDGYRGVIAQRPDLESIMPRPGSYELGGIVGKAIVTECVQSSNSRWYFGEFGFVLTDPCACQFYPTRGQLKFFNVDAPELVFISEAKAK